MTDYTDKGISTELLSEFRENLSKNDTLRLSQQVCTKFSLVEVLRKRKTDYENPHFYNNRIENEGRPVSNQHSSGRCWIFAMLNCMRQKFMKSLQLEEFEFSQSHLFYWDKLERGNYLLDCFLKAANRGEKPDGRLVSHLLKNPSEDGGQWHMLLNVVEKYGVMPKSCFPDSLSAKESRMMNMILNNKYREFCMRLFQLVEEKASSDEIKKIKKDMLGQIYNLVNISLGTPPATFTWNYYDKDKNYCSIGPNSSLEFYQKIVKPLFNMEDKIVLTNDPRPQNEYGQLYTVDFLGNMIGGHPTLYINQSIEVLKKCASESIRGGQAVWFGCDVGKFCSWKELGIEDLNAFDYNLVFGTDLLGQNKSDRLIYGQSLMTHAMVLTAYHSEEDRITKWRIENSWGGEGGDKGYLSMTDDWFSEFVYEIVVDKEFVPPEVLDLMKQDPVVLSAWDPMGALANCD